MWSSVDGVGQFIVSTAVDPFDSPCLLSVCCRRNFLFPLIASAVRLDSFRTFLRLHSLCIFFSFMRSLFLLIYFHSLFHAHFQFLSFSLIDFVRTLYRTRCLLLTFVYRSMSIFGRCHVQHMLHIQFFLLCLRRNSPVYRWRCARCQETSAVFGMW